MKLSGRECSPRRARTGARAAIGPLADAAYVLRGADRTRVSARPAGRPGRDTGPLYRLIAAAITVLPACTGADGGLDFSGGTCREHGEVFECSPLAETCGCEEDEACRPQFDGSRHCIAGGAIAEGGACAIGDECESGTWCVIGRCSAFCDLRPGGLGCGGTPCSDVAGEADFPFGACVHDGCDPVSGGGCGAGPGCSLVHFASDPQPVTVCLEAGPGRHGDPCDTAGCAAGHVCLRRMDESRTCVQVCEIGDDAPCAVLGACSGRFDEPVEVDGRRFGYCGG